MGHEPQIRFTSNMSTHVNRIVDFTNEDEKTVKHYILVTTMRPTLNELAIDVTFFRPSLEIFEIWPQLSGRMPSVGLGAYLIQIIPFGACRK